MKNTSTKYPDKFTMKLKSNEVSYDFVWDGERFVTEYLGRNYYYREADLNTRGWKDFTVVNNEQLTKDIASFTIKVEAKEATEAVDDLTQALVNCAKAYQHLKNVLGS